MKKFNLSQIMLKKITESEYFDADWYRLRYPDVELSGIEAAEHYLLIGAELQRDPGPNFSVKTYLNNIHNSKDAELSGFLHYLQYGKSEDRVEGPSPIKMNSGHQKLIPTDNIERLMGDVTDKRLPKEDSHAGPKPTGSKSTLSGAKIAGDLNIPATKTPILRGWLVKKGEKLPRTALLKIDGANVLEVIASHYRADLKKNNINDGFHAFEAAVPMVYIDGIEHAVSLIDKETGTEVKSAKATWSHNRTYSDFAGFLANSCTNPYISRPFREEDKRCFATMENIAASLVTEANALIDQPLISVIMPCYNRIDTIAESVKSVLEQSYGKFELLIVDDASTDGTLAWCKTLSDPRVKVISLKENGGASAARNAGLKKCSGLYIAYLDSDNLWDRRYLSAMIGAFQRLPDADAVYSGQFIYHGTSTEPTAVRFGSLNKSLLFNHNYVDMNAFCHTRASHKKIGGFDVTLKRFVDWDLILRFAQQGKMYSIPVLLCHYYLEKASNTITANKTHLNQLQQVREKHSISVGNSSDSGTTSVLDLPSKKYALKRRVTIVIPSYEALDDLIECVDSILSLKNSEMIDIIVVDNASAEPVKTYIERKSAEGHIKSICNSFNYGFTHAVNQGIGIADPTSDLILLNNDSIVTAGAIEALQKAAYELPACGLVVPQQVLPGETKTIQDHVPYADPKYACDVNLSVHHANIINSPLFNSGEVTEISFAPFFCVYIPRHVYSLAGPLDAQYGRHYRSDRIYCDVVRHVHNLKIYHIPQSLVFHKLQKATDTMRKDHAATSNFDLMFKKNQWDVKNREILGFSTAAWDL